MSENRRKKTGILTLLAAMGPGLLAALAGNDAGGIATFSIAGASYGFSLMWVIPITCLLLIVVQETAARMSCATGKGFASLIREQFGIRKSAFAMASLVISNTTVQISEFAGIAAGMELFGIPVWISVPVSALLVWLLTMGGSYRRIEKVLLLISCASLTYVLAGFMAKPDWNQAFIHTIIPHPVNDPDYISLLVAAIGTVISPYMIFLVGSNVVEKNLGADDLLPQRVDNVTGAIISQAISWFVCLTTAAVLFPAGIKIASAEDAARALVPLAGDYAATLFAAGLVGASFLAACVMPSITSNAVCEAFGWERGMDRSWSEAPTYHGIITATVLISAGTILMPNVDLFGIMMFAQVVNGILLPVLLFFLVNIANDRRVMGKLANGRAWNALTWFTIVTIVILTVAMFVLQALGH